MKDWKLETWHIGLLTALVAFLIFLSTLQTGPNGSEHPYATDIGELQNALPRWGTIHFSGYPQYSFLGSLFVTILRPFMLPAASTSLFSAVWGAAAVALLFWLITELNVRNWIAGLTAVLYALSTSLWVDASIAEIHTMTMALLFAVLVTAVRFNRTGEKSDLYWLAFLGSMGIVHQRAIAFVGLGILLLMWPHWRLVVRKIPQLIGFGILAMATYLYLPLRAWMGADWLFSAPGTTQGLSALIIDDGHLEDIVFPKTADEWMARIRGLLALLNDDWPWWLWLTGLVGLLLPGRTWRIRLALTVSWIPYLLMSWVVWEGYVSDALLAIKMPIIGLAAVGLAFILEAVTARQAKLGYVVAVVGVLAAGWLYVANRDAILAITQDTGVRERIGDAAQIPELADEEQVLMALWGHDYWALTYAQAYEDEFPHLQLVDHNSDFAQMFADGVTFYTLEKTLYQRPYSFWEEIAGPVYLTSAAPRIVELQTEPLVLDFEEAPILTLENGINIQEAQLVWQDENKLLLTVTWQAAEKPTEDYSVAVHVVMKNTPTGPQDIVLQADSSHPVYGWYPTSRWQEGEVVSEHYELAIPEGINPEFVRLGMYRQLADGSFENSEWLTLAIPESRP